MNMDEIVFGGLFPKPARERERERIEASLAPKDSIGDTVLLHGHGSRRREPGRAVGVGGGVRITTLGPPRAGPMEGMTCKTCRALLIDEPASCGTNPLDDHHRSEAPKDRLR